jgi:hypothetical protein
MKQQTVQERILLTVFGIRKMRKIGLGTSSTDKEEINIKERIFSVLFLVVQLKYNSVCMYFFLFFKYN